MESCKSKISLNDKVDMETSVRFDGRFFFYPEWIAKIGLEGMA